MSLEGEGAKGSKNAVVETQRVLYNVQYKFEIEGDYYEKETGRKKELTLEQKKDTDLWIIAIVSGIVYMCYAMFSKELSLLMKNVDIHVLLRLLELYFVLFHIFYLGLFLDSLSAINLSVF